MVFGPPHELAPEQHTTMAPTAYNEKTEKDVEVASATTAVKSEIFSLSDIDPGVYMRRVWPMNETI
jgi:hypothetical protein